jgi:hypothetical protein
VIEKFALYLAKILGLGSSTFDSRMRRLRQITNIRRLIRVALLAFAVMWNLPDANADFTFTPGHIYSTFDELGGCANRAES